MDSLSSFKRGSDAVTVDAASFADFFGRSKHKTLSIQIWNVSFYKLSDYNFTWKSVSSATPIDCREVLVEPSKSVF